MRWSRRRAALVALLALGAPAPAAGAAYDPRVELGLPTTGGPGSPAAIASTVTQAQGEDATKTIEAHLPGTFGFNSGFALTGCAAGDEAAGRCPESSRIGTIEAVSPFGEARGAMFLTEDFRLHGVLSAYGGLARFTVTGVLHVLPGQAVVVRFDDLPPIPTTRMRLALDGGARTPLALPRDCGTHAIEVRLVSHAGAERRSRHPVVVSGCRGLPALGTLRLDRRVLTRGASTVLRWRLRDGAAHTEVTLMRLRGGRWHEVLTRRVPARAGENRVGVGGSRAGRPLARGHYRLEVVAVAADGTRSLARSVDLRIR